MKRLLASCFALMLAGTANAIPFQISGSSLQATFEEGGALGGYLANSSGVHDLDVGDSFDFVFGTVFAPLALGNGEGTLTIFFGSPEPDGGVADTGAFAILALGIGWAGIEWGDPIEVGYSYGGLTGGKLKIDMFDRGENFWDGFYAGHFDIKGRITNLVNPTIAAVPEPGTVTLLGLGLLALGLSRFRRLSV